MTLALVAMAQKNMDLTIENLIAHREGNNGKKKSKAAPIEYFILLNLQRINTFYPCVFVRPARSTSAWPRGD